MIPINAPRTEDCAVSNVCPTCEVPTTPQRKSMAPNTNTTKPIEFIASFLGGYIFLLLVTMLSSPILNSLVLTLVLEME